MLKWPIFLSLFLLYLPLAFSNNRHEHFYATPSAKDFSSQIDSILNLKPSSQAFKNFFNSESELSEYLKTTFELDSAVADQLVKETKFNLTFKDLFSTLGGDPKIHLEKMLVASKNNPNHLQAYKNAEKIRLRLLLSLDEETVGKIFESYFKNEPKSNRSIIDASLSIQFQDPKQKAKLSLISDLAKKHETKMNFFTSIPRRNLEKETFELPETLKTLKKEGLIGGIDISGSISELNPLLSPEMKKELIGKNLRDIMNYAAENAIPLRVHAFEGANSGIFYDAFKEELLRYKGKKLELRIGHIAKLNRQWCETFRSVKENIHTTIEANLASNLYLNPETTAEELYKNIRLAREHSLPIYLGSDGRGILEGSSFIDQKALLKPYLEPPKQLPCLSSDGILKIIATHQK